MPIVYLGLGSNLGDREENLKKTRELLSKIGEIQTISKLYETEPHGVTDHPWYLNQCVKMETEFSPEIFFKKCQEIEKKMGRERKGNMPEPRTVDIDILFYDSEHIETDDLIIPHLRLHERKFVLVPLAGIAPDFVHPTFKKTILELLKECEDQSIVQAKR